MLERDPTSTVMKDRENASPSAETQSPHHSDARSLIRAATVADAKLIGGQRRRMFIENGLIFQGNWEDFDRAFLAWIEPRLRDESYIGWLAEEAGQIIAGAGVWFMDWPPHYRHIQPTRGYLLNFYTAPAARGRGFAKSFISLAIDECRKRGIGVAVLHATQMGAPIYRQCGFETGNEMTFSINS